MKVLEEVDPSSVPVSPIDGASLLVAGSRSFGEGLSHELVVEYVGDAVAALPVEPAEVVSGRARGGDRAGELYAETVDLPVNGGADSAIDFEPDWDQYGRAAGPRRNARMAHYADAALVFWDGSSPGSRSMLELGREVLGAEQVFVDLYRDGSGPAPVSLAEHPEVLLSVQS